MNALRSGRITRADACRSARRCPRRAPVEVCLSQAAASHHPQPLVDREQAPLGARRPFSEDGNRARMDNAPENHYVPACPQYPADPAGWRIHPPQNQTRRPGRCLSFGHAPDVTATLNLALSASGLDHITVVHRPRLLSGQWLILCGRRSGKVARGNGHGARARGTVSSPNPGKDRALAPDPEEPHSSRQLLFARRSRTAD